MGNTSVSEFPAFVRNGILCSMLHEVFFALGEGLAGGEDNEAGMVWGCNCSGGQLAFSDLVCLDTLLHIVEGFQKGWEDNYPVMFTRNGRS